MKLPIMNCCLLLAAAAFSVASSSLIYIYNSCTRRHLHGYHSRSHDGSVGRSVYTVGTAVAVLDGVDRRVRFGRVEQLESTVGSHATIRPALSAHFGARAVGRTAHSRAAQCLGCDDDDDDVSGGGGGQT